MMKETTTTMATTTKTTANPIPSFQLLQWKYAIKLEAKGLKNSRGSVTAHAKKKLGIKGSRNKVLAIIQKLLEERLPNEAKGSPS